MHKVHTKKKKEKFSFPHSWDIVSFIDIVMIQDCTFLRIFFSIGAHGEHIVLSTKVTRFNAETIIWPYGDRILKSVHICTTLTYFTILQ